MKRHVAIISQAHTDECRSLLTGLGRHEPVSRDWTTLLDRHLTAVAETNWLFDQRPDGVIHNHFSRELPRLCAERGIPCVDADDTAPAVSGAPKVKRDNYAVGRLAFEHFASLNYQSFAFLGYRNCPRCQEIFLGFKNAALRIRPLATPSSLYLNVRLREPDERVATASHSPDAAQIETWLGKLPPGVAILAADDLTAVRALQVASEMGLHCPQDFAILGVGNESVHCELSKPALSSIDLNGRTRGKVIAQTLHTLMENPRASFPSIVTIPPYEVVTRESTDSAAVPDKMLARALAIIRERARHGLRVDDLVAQSHTSRRLLERRFQKHLGKSPNAAIREAIVSKIKTLLAGTDKPLAEIAYETGFTHPEYMNVVFKKQTGMTPGHYRQTYSPQS